MNYGKTPEEKAVLERLGWGRSAPPATCNWCRFASSHCLRDAKREGQQRAERTGQAGKNTAIQAQLDDLDRLNNALSARVR